MRDSIPRLFLMALGIGLAAAATHPLLAAEAVDVRLRLLAFEAALQRPEVYLHDDAADEASVPVKTAIRTYLNHESILMPMTGSRLLVSSLADRAAPDSRLAECTLPAGARSAILLFLPDRGGGAGQAKVVVVPDLTGDFPAGSFQVCNFSPAEVRIMLEKEVHAFEPGGMNLIKDPPARENRQIGMRAFIKAGEGWKQVANGLWAHPGKRRSLMVIFRDPATDSIHLRAFDDIEPRPLPEDKP